MNRVLFLLPVARGPTVVEQHRDLQQLLEHKIKNNKQAKSRTTNKQYRRVKKTVLLSQP